MALTRNVRLYMAVMTLTGVGVLLALRGWGPPVTPDFVFWLPLLGGIALIPTAGYCQICIARNVTVNMGGAVMMPSNLDASASRH